MTLNRIAAGLPTIIQARIDKGTCSVKLLAAKTSIKPSHLSNFIHRRRQLSVTALSQVLAALGLEPELRYTEKDQTTPPPPLPRRQP